MTTPTWTCRRCWSPIIRGLFCPRCVDSTQQIVDAAGTPNCPETNHNAVLARADLETHREWVRTGHVPASARA